MKKLIFSLVMCVLVSGCETLPIKTQIVEVPIKTKCFPTLKITEIPVYPTSNMNKEMSLYDKLGLVLSENYLLTGQNIELKAALAECTK